MTDLVKRAFEEGFRAGAEVVQQYGRANSGLRLGRAWLGYAYKAGPDLFAEKHAFEQGYDASTQVAGTYDSPERIAEKGGTAWIKFWGRQGA